MKSSYFLFRAILRSKRSTDINRISLATKSLYPFLALFEFLKAVSTLKAIAS